MRSKLLNNLNLITGNNLGLSISQNHFNHRKQFDCPPKYLDFRESQQIFMYEYK